jgi:hypothetical protein
MENVSLEDLIKKDKSFKRGHGGARGGRFGGSRGGQQRGGRGNQVPRQQNNGPFKKRRGNTDFELPPRASQGGELSHKNRVSNLWLIAGSRCR